MNYPLFFCPSIEGGGVEKNLYLISNYISSKFKKVYVLTANKDMKNKFNKKIIFISPKSDKWCNSNRILKSLICLLLLLREKKNFLVISFQSNILAILMSKILGFKVIIRSNTAPEKYLNSNLKKYIFKFFFRLSDEIIVNSFSFQKSLKKILSINSKVIYNPSKKISYVKRRKTKKYLKIINVGRLTNQKNQILLLKSLKILSKKVEWKLSIIGRGYNLLKLKNYIKNNDLKKKVKLYGYLKNPIKLIADADLFVLTSNYEGLPNVLIEAQQVGTPIISTDCPTGPREILLNGKLGKLNPINDYLKLAKNIEDFYLYRKKYLKKSILAKKYLNRFDLKRNCELYKDLIKENLD